MKLKVSFALSAIILIVFSQIISLFGFLELRYSNKKYLDKYETVISRSLNEKDAFHFIQEALYLHEAVLNQYMGSTADNKAAEIKDKFIEAELKLRQQLIRYGKLMSSVKNEPVKYELFKQVNNDILKYLNYSSVLFYTMHSSTQKEIENYTYKFVTPLIDNVNSSIMQIITLSEAQNLSARRNLRGVYRKTGKIQAVLIVIIVLTFIITVLYSHRVLTNLEGEKILLKLKNELDQKKITDMQHKTIIGIADLIESRSGETGRHVKRTSRIVNMILEKAFTSKKWPEIVNEHYIDIVTRAAPLHDVGKITVPDAILHKPGKLTDEEFSKIKAHSVAGEAILSSILNGIEEEDYVQVAREIAKSHHEKWNGKGYPFGLKENEIPLCARVMAIADVFDALISKRCYKEPIPLDKAFEIIKAESGQHFDPELVEIFMSLKGIIKINADKI